MLTSRPAPATPQTDDPLDHLAAHVADEEAAVFGRLPDRAGVAAFADGVVSLLFPDGSDAPRTPAGIRAELEARCAALVPVLLPMGDALPDRPEAIAARFVQQLPAIHEAVSLDAEAIEAGDPAAHGVSEVVLAYPGFTALAFYRIARVLYLERIPLVPRMVSEIAHSRTGVDIHPGATIGRSCCIDHGTGVVVGETAVIGDNVKLYQGVTLGALSVSKQASGTKRHPTIGDRVVIYAGATVLGGDTVVGHDSIIGGNVWLTHSVPANSLVYHQSQVRVRTVGEMADPIDFVI
ncbi:MAG TPA: serine O-acetyltransferase EpsC [Candidatus Limnocylindrales bacterium]|nr:serine O-acetyltransferase EpsC [Candidatus Limnocylindrales bacterium]